MSNFKEKSQSFIIGLMTGLLIAGGFFILKLDDYFKELNFYKNIAKTFVSDAKNLESSVKSEDVEPVKEKKTKPSLSKNKSISSADSIDLKKAKTDLVLDADTLKKYLAVDTVEIKNPSAITSSSSEDIVVRKDELLSTKTVEIINLSTVTSNRNSKDSLLQKVSGIKDDKSITKQFINIELWQSPLNYRGYKMGKYKIALYGLTSLEALKIYILDDVIYLKNGAIVNKLENSSEFRPYERITEENLISKLK
ncbi:MAG: hypothetical protein K8R85_09825 [Bacteroidetes bacterium]|nr:hypothetical protein [Bacteroidota bacterium]